VSTVGAAAIRALVERASDPIPLLWPLQTAIAANPLWDERQQDFSEAVATAHRVLGAQGWPASGYMGGAFLEGRITEDALARALAETVAATGDGPTGRSAPNPAQSGCRLTTLAARQDRARGTRVAPTTDREVAKWCAVHMAGRSMGGTFYTAWLAGITWDPVARRLGLSQTRGHSPGPEAAIVSALEAMGLEQSDWLDEITAQLARLPGWAAHAKWRSRWAAPDTNAPNLDLVDLLAVRLAYDAAGLAATNPATADGPASATGVLGRVGLRSGGRSRHPESETARHTGSPSGDAWPDVPAPPAANGDLAGRLLSLDGPTAAAVWLRAFEITYRDSLLGSIDARGAAVSPERPAAQVVCCIDTRSEGLRRHLEALGPYETFGFAGFFGVPARVHLYGSEDHLDLCPVLLSPTTEVSEKVGRGVDPLPTVLDRAALGRAAVETRKDQVAPYLLAEGAGFAMGPLAVWRTLSPRRFGRSRRRVDPPAASASLEFDLDNPGAPSDDEQAAYAETALRAMGLTEGFAPIVVLCGHGSTTTNNPYASALDCGACGAARGGRSARLAAAICNREPVRRILARAGLDIPEHTLFVAAEHDTATDSVTLFDPGPVAPARQSEIARVAADLNRAGQALAAERSRDLPALARRPTATGADEASRHVADRSADWAQVQPEWGLARNAAFIVAPRSLTSGVDLQRRCFLHSYDPGSDPDGAVLETILTGPMVVAHWINAAYYFATVDPDVYGAGDKTAHNVVAGIGVHQGAGGDLKIGLPLQSVFIDRDRPYHEPMRLQVLVECPRERLDDVVGRNPVLSQLAGGAWVHMACREQDRWWLRQPGGAWQPWQASTDEEDPNG
jgi:uncharacterized protein YbcC (UPF0753/DUF2309 family)